MKPFVRVAAGCTFLCFTQLAQAVPTASWTMTDTHTYGRVVDFDQLGRIATNTMISKQFQSEGLSFSGTVRANGCGFDAWPGYGMKDNYLNTFGPDCFPNELDDVFAIKFDQAVSTLAMDAFLSDNSRIASLDLYLKGKLVSHFSMPTLSYEGLAANSQTVINGRNFINTNVDRAGILRIDGALFDEIRFAENWDQNHYGYLFFDNLRFGNAPAKVPEPASLGLLAVGLAGIGAMRRRHPRP